ncbi:MAG: molybdopterin molybdotransferase [Thermodesulfobacteriota bacterium]|nr:molybdopterin molybdotransferase [Thermodesulfobacteriota bacterium]
MKLGQRGLTMLDIGEAQRKILEEIPVLGSERIHILEALGRVLAQDVEAIRDVPPADNSAMDGYCCKAQDIQHASVETPIRLRMIGESPAGKPFQGTVGPGEAVRVMTGGLIPNGADTVIMVEFTERTGEDLICLQAPGVGAHIRRTGEDVRAGEVVLAVGDIVRPPEVGMLATLGHAYVHVYQRPVVAILSTGDELVDLDEPFSPGKVVCSNSYSLAAQVYECGAIPLSLGIATDDHEHQRSRISDGLRADVLVTSGGVSVGNYDLVKDTLAQLGMQLKFWKVNMKPGKPLVFGTIAKKPVFGLPGNPTSAMISFEQFVRPALLKMMGHKNLWRPLVEAVLEEDLKIASDRVHLVRCKLSEKEGTIMARPTGTQSSGALRSMILADGLMILPPERVPFRAGNTVKVQVLHGGMPLVPLSPYDHESF